MSRKSLKFISIIRAILMFFLFFSIKTYALSNKDCYVNSTAGKGYAISYSIKVNDIVANTQNGAVVGTISVRNTNFICPSTSYAWRLQVLPNATPVSGSSTVCRTNINGIGVQYLNYLGNPINCNSWDDIFIIPSSTTNATLREGVVLARIIKVDGRADNGEYQLLLSSSLSSYYPGATTGSPWGNLELQGSGRVYFSNLYPQIYFPSSPYYNPVIRLNIKNKYPGSNSTSIQDSTTLDMCLYDGSNSTSRGVKITFKDNTSGVSNRPPGYFSIFRRDGDNSQINNRLDYVVSVINPVTGSRQEVNNGVEVYWAGVNEKRLLRQVILPGVPGVSLCVPAPVTLSTSLINNSGKMAGNYSGTLTIIYTPST